MPNIEKVELPAAADGSAQWFKIHRIATHGQVKAIAAVYGDADANAMDLQTRVVRTLVSEAVVKDDEGREIPWGTGDEQGVGIDDVPQALVMSMFDAAAGVVADAFPGLGGNRAGRRQAAKR